MKRLIQVTLAIVLVVVTSFTFYVDTAAAQSRSLPIRPQSEQADDSGNKVPQKAAPISPSAPIELAGNSRVFWSLAPQSGQKQEVQIVDDKGVVIVDTSVLSTSLSNISFGNFDISGSSGEEITYNVKFISHTTDIRRVDSAITVGRGTVSQTYLYAVEDGTDYDYNDAFLTITWLNKG